MHGAYADSMTRATASLQYLPGFDLSRPKVHEGGSQMQEAAQRVMCAAELCLV